MAETLQISFGGNAAEDAFYDDLLSLEVEENLDLPDAIRLKLPVNATEKGELDYPTDDRLKPFSNVTVVVTPEGAGAECIFDGYLLAQKLHLETSLLNSSVEAWGEDASWLMNLEEKVQEWTGKESDVAAAIFDRNGVAAADANRSDDSPEHTETGHTLMQRGTDIQFLRSLARRTGKLCRVYCESTPGARKGWFAKPALEGDPVATLKLNDIEDWNVRSLDLEWDVMRPTEVKSGQALLNQKDPTAADQDVTGSGLALLDVQGLKDFTGRDMKVLLAAPVDDAGELQMRAQAVLRETGWFVRCTAEVEVARIGRVIRAGQLVAIEQLGSVHSGTYLVWSVRHTIDEDSHVMRLTLVRNAVGSSGSAPGLSALAGALAGALA